MEAVKLNLNPLQLEQVKLGLAHKIDASQYSSSEYSWEHMALIRQLMEDGYDPAKLLNPKLPYDECRLLAKQIEVDSGELHLTPEEMADFLK